MLKIRYIQEIYLIGIDIMYNKNMNGGRKILQFIRSIFPLKLQLKIEYRIKYGRKLNLKTPKRYTEKIQLYKYKYRNPLLPKLVDKAEVREYVIKKGLGHILNEVYGIYERSEEHTSELQSRPHLV